jgi:cysteine sulfinate desulfinase/cysteine desulfurase-like protein
MVLSNTGATAAVRPDTALVSIMHAYNVVGTMPPIAEIVRLIKPMGGPKVSVVISPHGTSSDICCASS